MLAFGLYKLLKFGEYETANPGQDFNEQERMMFHAPSDPVLAEDVARPNTTAIEAERAVQQATEEIVRNVTSSELRQSQSSTAALQETRSLVEGRTEEKLE